MRDYGLVFKIRRQLVEISPQQTSEPRPEPVVISVQEPIQDPGENGAVVVGGRLLLSLWGRLAETRRGNKETRVKSLRGRNIIPALVKLQDVRHNTVIVINY